MRLGVIGGVYDMIDVGYWREKFLSGIGRRLRFAGVVIDPGDGGKGLKYEAGCWDDEDDGVHGVRISDAEMVCELKEG